MSFRFLTALVAFTSALIACSNGGSDSSSSSSGTSAMTTLVSTMASKIDGAAGILDATSFAALNRPRILVAPSAPSFNDSWLTTTSVHFFDVRDSSSPAQISAQDYMGIQIDENAVNDNGSGVNAFGRMKNAFQIFCAVGVGAKLSGYTIDSSGYLDNGTYAITFTSAIKSAMTSTCEIDTSSIPDGSVVNLTVTSGSTNYDKKLAFDLFDQNYWVKNDSTVLRIATAEDDTGNYSRTTAEYNKSTNVTRSEYVYVSSSGSNQVFRLYYDGNNDEGAILGFSGSDSGVTTGNRYLVSGKPNTGDALNLSMRDDVVFSSTSSFNACVLSATGTIDTDGSLCSASSTRLAGANISTANGTFSTWYSTYGGSGASGSPSDWGTTGLTDADVIGFTSIADIATTALNP